MPVPDRRGPPRRDIVAQPAPPGLRAWTRAALAAALAVTGAGHAVTARHAIAVVTSSGVPGAAGAGTSAGAASFVVAAQRMAAGGVPSDQALDGASRTVLSSAALSSQPLSWSAGACHPTVRTEVDRLRRAGSTVTAVCARVQVPLDWDNPSLGSVTTQVTRIPREKKAGDARPTRVLLVNPGGPGAPAGPYAVDFAEVESQLRPLYDVVGVDPRGSGGSTPLDCPVARDSLTDYRNPTTQAVLAQQRAAQQTVSGCVTRAGWYLPHISTRQMVSDHEYVRDRLGVDVVDWMGISAGTWLAAQYAQRYPTRTGRVVLDSSVSLTQPWDASFALQPNGFQRRFEQQFLPWAARHPEYGLGASPAQVKTSYEQVRSASARGRYTGVWPRDVDELIVRNLYSDSGFPQLAAELAGLLDTVGGIIAPPGSPTVRRGSVASIASAVRAATPHDGSARPVDTATKAGDLMGARHSGRQVDDAAAESTVFMAVQCNDTPSPRDEPSQVTQGMRLGAAYPLVGWTWVASWCTYWPYAPTSQPVPIGAGAASMLMVQDELDPATPWEGAVRSERLIGSIRLLTVDNAGGHGAFARDNECVETSVGGYLLTGLLPAAGALCPATPLPGDEHVYEVGMRAPLTRAGAAPVVASRTPAQAIARQRADEKALTPGR
ncbi:MAG: alpha/beta hydrolase [Dermatophilaceae bacterium]